MPQLDISMFPSQLFWLAVTFAFLYLVLSNVALPNIREVLQQRQDRITSDLDKAEASQKEADTVKNSYTDALTNARAQSVAMLSAASTAILKEIAVKNSALEVKITKKLEEAEAEITALREKAVTEMKTVTLTTAQALVEQLIDKKLDAAEVEAAISK